jgi:formiminotetrahydrofolate cyclodeaminase
VQLLELSVQAWLDQLGDHSPAPGGGAAAAVAAAMGASLVALTARHAEGWIEAGGVAAQAVALQHRLARLAQDDADVYAEALDLLDHRGEIPVERRDHELGQALARAAEAPVAIAEAAADVTALAVEAAGHAPAQLRADAEAGAALAAAAAQAAARLVEVNLATMRDDERAVRARTAAEAAVQTVRRAFSDPR